MAEKQLKSIKFAGLGDTYVLPEIDDSLSTSGMAADAKATGDALALKAPSGYGLGVSEPVIITDCNLAVKSGWYKTTDETLNIPVARGNWMRVDAYNDKWTHQVWFNDTNGGGEVHRYQQNGIWTEWEWENPPYNWNKVYRTTERFCGYPVYAVNVACGMFVHGGTSITVPMTEDYIGEEWTIVGYEGGAVYDAVYMGNSGVDMIAKTGEYPIWYAVKGIRASWVTNGLLLTIEPTGNHSMNTNEGNMFVTVKFIKREYI